MCSVHSWESPSRRGKKPPRLVRVPRTRTCLGQDTELRVDALDECLDRHACRREHGLPQLPQRWSATDLGVRLVREGPDHRLLARRVPLYAEHPLVQADDRKERGEIPLDKEDIASACLKLGEPRVHLPPLVDDPTADAEHVLGVVPRALDHLEIRERDIGVYPLPLASTALVTCVTVPMSTQSASPTNSAKVRGTAVSAQLLVVQPRASNQTTTAEPMRCRMSFRMRPPRCRGSSHWTEREKTSEEHTGGRVGAAR